VAIPLLEDCEKEAPTAKPSNEKALFIRYSNIFEALVKKYLQNYAKHPLLKLPNLFIILNINIYQLVKHKREKSTSYFDIF
jgi:hypothetical protein